MRGVVAIPGLRSLYLVTHDVDLALTHADRILLFREGRVVADGPPMEVIADTARWKACNLRFTSLMRGQHAMGAGRGTIPRCRHLGAPDRRQTVRHRGQGLEGRPRE